MERKRWISSFPSVPHLQPSLPPAQKERKEKLTGDGIAGEETYSSRCEQKGRGREAEIGGSLPQ